MDSGCILITGASGLIGHALMTCLKDQGDRVVGIDRMMPPAPATDMLKADVLDADALLDICARNSVRTIVHCGGVSGRAVARDDPLGTIRTNVVGTANVFEAARKLGVGRVILCSSGSVYGCIDDDPVREDAVLRPLNVYGASKIASEAILHAYATGWHVDGVALRIFQVFGPRPSS